MPESVLGYGRGIIALPSDYTVVDLETTGLSRYYDEIIELAAIKVRDNKAVTQFQSLVKPCCPISNFITTLTGITNEMVANSPSIEEVIGEFVGFIGGDIIVGHNVGFDVGFLKENYSIHCGKVLNNDFVNTVRLAKKVVPGLPCYKLEFLKDALQIEFSGDAHRALNDCHVTNMLFQRLGQSIREMSPDLSLLREWFHQRGGSHKRIKIEEIVCQTDTSLIDKDNPFYDRNVCVTGVLERLSRRDAFQLIVNLGGHVQNSVTMKTNYLVVGCNDYCSSIKDGKSTKQKNAESYMLKGCDIKVLDEKTFYEIVEME